MKNAFIKKLTATPAGKYLFKVNNRNTRTRTTPLAYFTLTYFTPCSSVSIVNFEQVNAGCDIAFYSPVSYHWPLFTPPETIRKPVIFRCFQGVSKETVAKKRVYKTIHSLKNMSPIISQFFYTFFNISKSPMC